MLMRLGDGASGGIEGVPRRVGKVRKPDVTMTGFGVSLQQVHHPTSYYYVKPTDQDGHAGCGQGGSEYQIHIGHPKEQRNARLT